MMQTEKDFCFCTLAIRKKYRLLAQQLAEDLEKYSPGTFLVIYTDEPKDFSENRNVLAFNYSQKGILHCYQDKRFVIEKALSKFRAAIFIDADTRIIDRVPDIEWKPGLTGRQENLVEHIQKYCSYRLPFIKTMASKLNIVLEEATYIGDSLFIVAREQGKEIEFFRQWGKIGTYFELKGIHSGLGNTMALAAAKTNLSISTDGWESLNKVAKHMDASDQKTRPSFWNQLNRRIGYHYRLNRTRLMALKDFDFYYR